MWLLLLLFVLLIFCSYLFLRSNYAYWKKRGVPNPPVSLLFGNLGPSLSLEKSLGQIYSEIYNNYPDLLYVGYYKIRQPAIVVRDPELIKSILNKEFNSFHDNDIEVDEKVDPIGGKNPFVAKGHRWKISKSQLTPNFTPKKLKSMYPLIEDSVKKLIEYLHREPEASGINGLDTKELCAKYSTDVVASCAFGLDGKSFVESDPEFRRMGKKIFSTDTVTIIKFLLITIFPSLTKVFKLKLISDEIANYFRNIISATLKYREQNNIVRNDFLDFMKDLRASPGEFEFTDDDLLSHALGFFTDGFETSSAVLSYILFELASNSDIQNILFEEVKETLVNTKGKLDYDTLNSMHYLDAIVSETLRMHPPGLAILRCCTKPFTFPPPRGTGTGPDVPVEVGIPISIPIYALHYDPQYFTDPKRFNPDRFLGDNKNNIIKGTYLPFGEGPRGCHGQRFGLMQIKAAVASLVVDFEIKVNKKTKTPLEIDPASLINQPKGGIWLNFLKRL